MNVRIQTATTTIAGTAEIPVTQARPIACSAFTLIELIVSIGVICILVGLTLPAIQSARENSRRLACANNLRQIGVAIEGHVASTGAMPYGQYLRLKGNVATVTDFGPHSQLLAYLGEVTLYNAVNFDLGGSGYYGRVDNETAEYARIGVFLCPSQPSTPFLNNYRANTGSFPDPMAAMVYPYKSGYGAFTPLQRANRLVDFADGLSSTVLFSERCMGDGIDSVYTPFSDVWFAVNSFPPPQLSPDEYSAICGSLTQTRPAHSSNGGHTWLYVGNLTSLYSHTVSPNGLVPDCGNYVSPDFYSLVSARSYHPGGVNVLLGDGSVRKVSNAIDLKVWRAIGGRDDNLTVDAEF